MSSQSAGSAAATSAVLAQWDAWSSACTDRLFELDARVTANGTADDRLDLAAVFVARRAVVDRIAAMQALDPRLGARFESSCAALAAQPLVDAQGSPVAGDLAGAAHLIDAVLSRIEQRITSVEHDDAQLAAATGTLDADLADATRLSEQLGLAAGRVADLTNRRAAASRSTAVLAPLAAEVASLAGELRAADARRTTLLRRLQELPTQIDALRVREAEVRAVMAMVREKVRPVPNLAAPSVAALGEPDTAEALAALPWAAAQARLEPFVTKVDRLGAAFDEVERRHRAALDRRDDLRGLLQAYRDKAGARGLAEHPVLEPQYRAAEAVLWSAPCDLDEAERLTTAYTQALGAMLGQPVASSTPSPSPSPSSTSVSSPAPLAADAARPLVQEDLR